MREQTFEPSERQERAIEEFKTKLEAIMVEEEWPDKDKILKAFEDDKKIPWSTTAADLLAKVSADHLVKDKAAIELREQVFENPDLPDWYVIEKDKK